MVVVEGLLRLSLGAIHASLWLRGAIYYSLLWLWTGLVYAVKHKGSKLECIQEDAKELKKIPLHLTLIVHEERLSHTDLAKVVTWAFAAGIHQVSIYNSQGEHTNIKKQAARVLNISMSVKCCMCIYVKLLQPTRQRVFFFFTQLCLIFELRVY